MCPIKLDSMFEISHADLLESLIADQRSVDRCSSSFHALRILRSTYLPVFPPGICRKKFDVWESEYIQGPQERLMGLFPICYNLFCSQLNHISLHMDVKERAVYLSCVALENRRLTGWKMVGLIGLEPMTPALSRRCSNQLSYRPLLRLSFEGQALAELAVVKGCLQAMACHS